LVKLEERALDRALDRAARALVRGVEPSNINMGTVRAHQISLSLLRHLGRRAEEIEAGEDVP
jgi:hypothetical protein